MPRPRPRKAPSRRRQRRCQSEAAGPIEASKPACLPCAATRVAIFLLLTLASCGTRTVFIPPQGAATRVGPSVTGRIYTYDAASKTWVLSGGPANYPEGAYIVIRPDATTLPASP